MFEGYPDAEAVNTLTLDERDRTTTLRVVLDRFEDLVRSPD